MGASHSQQRDKGVDELLEERTIATNQVGKWVSPPPPPSGAPTPRSGHASAIQEDGEALWIFGGYYENPQGLEKTGYTDLHRYHVASNTWTRAQTHGTSPVTSCSQSAVIVGNKFYLFGGTGVPFGVVNSGDLYCCDLTTLEWSILAAENSPAPRFGQSMVAGPDNCLYVFGGTDGHIFYDDLYRFDIEHRSWERVRPDGENPCARYRHMAVFVGTDMIIVGGGWPFPHPSAVLDHVHVYHTVSGVWERVTCRPFGSEGFPASRRSHTAVRMGTHILVMGGLRQMDDLTLDTWVLDTATMAWAIASGWNWPAYFHTCDSAPNGTVVTFGGVARSRDRVNRVCIYQARVPSLRRLCIHAIAAQRCYDRHALREYGLAMRVIEEILPSDAA
eukprot:m.45820 g.45820  ORF g.45820 m.45820 type:complete len:389 (-) comp5898_c0_seq2:2893-4059(-)